MLVYYENLNAVDQNNFPLFIYKHMT